MGTPERPTIQDLASSGFQAEQITGWLDEASAREIGDAGLLAVSYCNFGAANQLLEAAGAQLDTFVTDALGHNAGLSALPSDTDLSGVDPDYLSAYTAIRFALRDAARDSQEDLKRK